MQGTSLGGFQFSFFPLNLLSLAARSLLLENLLGGSVRIPIWWKLPAWCSVRLWKQIWLCRVFLLCTVTTWRPDGPCDGYPCMTLYVPTVCSQCPCYCTVFVRCSLKMISLYIYIYIYIIFNKSVLLPTCWYLMLLLNVPVWVCAPALQDP